MKKVLIGLFAMSALAFADNGVNVYTKVGFDLKSKYTSFKFDEIGKSTSKKGAFSGTLALEATKNVNSAFELGLGIAYKTKEKNSELKLSKEVKEADGMGLKDGVVDVKIAVPRYRKIPVYLVAKYNFDLGSALKPYAKLDLGYSFNKANKAEHVAVYTPADEQAEKVVQKDSNSPKVKNSLYAALSVGAEYDNFLAELSYVHTPAKVKSEAGSFKYKNKAVKLSVGYKFSF